MVIPDQRGYNKSDTPTGSENYTAKILVADMWILANLIFGSRKFNLAGHDFGAAIAYAMVFKFPDFINKLIVVNGKVEVLFLYKGVSKQIIPKI